MGKLYPPKTFPNFKRRLAELGYAQHDQCQRLSSLLGESSLVYPKVVLSKLVLYISGGVDGYKQNGEIREGVWGINSNFYYH